MLALSRVAPAFAERGSGAYLANVVHDEVIVVCPDAEAQEVAELVKQEMQAAFEDVLPEAQYGVRCGVEVGVARHWMKA